MEVHLKKHHLLLFSPQLFHALYELTLVVVLPSFLEVLVEDFSVVDELDHHDLPDELDHHEPPDEVQEEEVHL